MLGNHWRRLQSDTYRGPVVIHSSDWRSHQDQTVSHRVTQQNRENILLPNVLEAIFNGPLEMTP